MYTRGNSVTRKINVAVYPTPRCTRGMHQYLLLHPTPPLDHYCAVPAGTTKTEPTPYAIYQYNAVKLVKLEMQHTMLIC